MNFPIVVANGEGVLSKVFPTKQRDVHTAIQIAKSDPRIKRLILFGSAISTRCGTDSDIDLAVDSEMSAEQFAAIAHKFYVGVPSEIDVINLNNLHNELLKNEIAEKGVEIYAI